MSDVREYVFRGTLRTLIGGNNACESRLHRRYTAQGRMMFLGRRSDNSRIEIPLAEEPTDASHRYTVVGDGVNAYNDDGDDASMSEAVDDDEPEAGGSAARRFKAKETHLVVVRDRNVLLLPHIGMFVSLVLRRAEPCKRALLVDPSVADALERSGLQQQSDEPLAYDEYQYDIWRVKFFKPLQAMHRIDMIGSLSSPVESLRVLRERAARNAFAESNRWRVNSAALYHDKKKKTANRLYTPVDPDWTKIISAATDRVRSRAATFAQLLNATGHDYTINQIWLGSFANWYCWQQNELTSFGGQPVERPALVDCARQLRLQTGRDINKTSALELRSIDAWLADNEPQYVPFFGALDVADARTLVASPFIGAWQGYQMIKQREKQLFTKVGKYARKQLRRAMNRTVDPKECVELAYRMHCEQQRPWRRDNDVIDLPDIVRSINTYWRNDDDPVYANELDGALIFLESIGAWQLAPDATTLRLSFAFDNTSSLQAHDDEDEHALHCSRNMPFYCTARAAGTASRLVTALRRLERSAWVTLLAQSTAGSLDASLCTTPTALICASIKPSEAALHHNSSVLCIDDVLSAEPGTVALALAAYDQIALVDAHTCSAPQLTCVLRAINAAVENSQNDVPVVLSGDCGARASTFARLASAYGTRLEHHTPPRNETRTDTRLLREAATLASQNNAGGTQALVERMQILLEANVDTCLQQHLRMRRGARLLLVGEQRNDVAQMIERVAKAVQSMPTCGEQLQRVLDRLQADNALYRCTVFAFAPLIGIGNRALPVLALYAIDEPCKRLDYLNKNHCTELPWTAREQTQYFSLDADNLLVAVDGVDIDHRLCCRTWAPNIVDIRMHRAELSAQSLATPATALPHTNSVANTKCLVLFGTRFTMNDLHAVLSAGVNDKGRVIPIDLTHEQLSSGLASRYHKYREHFKSIVPDLLSE